MSALVDITVGLLCGGAIGFVIGIAVAVAKMRRGWSRVTDVIGRGR